jgi:hypothetical protein
LLCIARLRMPLLASGSRRAATSGCEGREGAGQTVKEHDRRSIYAGPLTRHFSPAVTVLNSLQFHGRSVGADLYGGGHLELHRAKARYDLLHNQPEEPDRARPSAAPVARRPAGGSAPPSSAGGHQASLVLQPHLLFASLIVCAAGAGLVAASPS